MLFESMKPPLTLKKPPYIPIRIAFGLRPDFFIGWIVSKSPLFHF